MLKIGFANKFYTLWSVSEPYRQYVTAESWYDKTDFNFYQNLSFDLEAAKEKVKKLHGVDAEFVDGLKGTSSYTYSSDLKWAPVEDYQFSSGYEMYSDIRTSTNVEALLKEFRNEEVLPQREFAKARLIELGELIEYKGEWLSKYGYEEKLKAEKISNELKKVTSLEVGKEITIEFDCTKNPGIYREEDDERITTVAWMEVPNYMPNLSLNLSFPEFAKLNYKGYDYALPTVNGKAKRVKGKRIRAVVIMREPREGVDTTWVDRKPITTNVVKQSGEVKSFEILK